MAHRGRPYESDSDPDDYDESEPRRDAAENNGLDAADTAARELALAQLQLKDLCKGRSDHLRTFDPRDKDRNSAVDQDSLAKSRLSNVEGTPEYTRTQQAAKQLGGWNNFHTTEDHPDEGDMVGIQFNDGQSHRQGLQKAFHPDDDHDTEAQFEDRTRPGVGRGDVRNTVPHRPRPTKPPKQLEKDAAKAGRRDENTAGNNRPARQQPAHLRDISKVPRRPSPIVTTATNRVGPHVKHERPEARPDATTTHARPNARIEVQPQNRHPVLPGWDSLDDSVSSHAWFEQANKTFSGPTTPATQADTVHSRPPLLLGGPSIHAVPGHHLLDQGFQARARQPDLLIDLTEEQEEGQDTATEVSEDTISIEAPAYEPASTEPEWPSTGFGRGLPPLATMLRTDRIMQEIRTELANFERASAVEGNSPLFRLLIEKAKDAIHLRTVELTAQHDRLGPSVLVPDDLLTDFSQSFAAKASTVSGPIAESSSMAVQATRSTHRHKMKAVHSGPAATSDFPSPATTTGMSNSNVATAISPCDPRSVERPGVLNTTNNALDALDLLPSRLLPSGSGTSNSPLIDMSVAPSRGDSNSRLLITGFSPSQWDRLWLLLQPFGGETLVIEQYAVASKTKFVATFASAATSAKAAESIQQTRSGNRRDARVQTACKARVEVYEPGRDRLGVPLWKCRHPKGQPEVAHSQTQLIVVGVSQDDVWGDYFDDQDRENIESAYPALHTSNDRFTVVTFSTHTNALQALYRIVPDREVAYPGSQLDWYCAHKIFWELTEEEMNEALRCNGVPEARFQSDVTDPAPAVKLSPLAQTRAAGQPDFVGVEAPVKFSLSTHFRRNEDDLVIMKLQNIIGGFNEMNTLKTKGVNTEWILFKAMERHNLNPDSSRGSIEKALSEELKLRRQGMQGSPLAPSDPNRMP